MKNNQLNTLLITVGLVVVILYLSKPKNNLLSKSSVPPKIAPPKALSENVASDKENGAIVIDAMRNAINDGIPQSEIDNLQATFVKEYGLKVFFGENGKLVAKNAKSQIVTKE